MPDFDPDAYLAKNAGGGGFDPDAYLAKHSPPPPDMFKAAGDALPGALNTINAGVRGALDMVPGSHRFIAAVQGEPVADVDARYAKDLEDHPAAFRTGQVGGALALPIPKGIGGMAALGAAQGAGDSRGGFLDMLKQAGIGGAAGGALGGAFKAGGRVIGDVAGSALPWLQKLEQKYAGEVGSKFAKSAQDTANSARGTLGANTQQGSTTLKNLEHLIGKTGDPATDAASRAILDGPQGQALAKQLAESAQAKAPSLFDQIANSRTLADTTAQEAKDAYALGQTPEVARKMLQDRGAAQLRRYAVPTVLGAAGGALFGDDHKGLGAVGGAAVGLASNRQTRAIANLFTGTESRRLLSGAAVSAATKLARMSTSQPELLGKFALPLSRALEGGPDAIAATHLKLATDPDYQQLMHSAAESDQ